MLAIRRLDSSQPGFNNELAQLLAFESAQDPKVESAAREILSAVKSRGDAALLETTARFDRWTPANAAALEVDRSTMQQALQNLPKDIRAALETIPPAQHRDFLRLWLLHLDDHLLRPRVGGSGDDLGAGGEQDGGSRSAPSSSLIFATFPHNFCGNRHLSVFCCRSAWQSMGGFFSNSTGARFPPHAMTFTGASGFALPAGCHEEVAKLP